MIVLPIIHTTRDDELYAVIGCAIAFATNFEINCKALEALTRDTGTKPGCYGFRVGKLSLEGYSFT